MHISNWKVGDERVLTREVTRERILKFVEISGDRNPVHLCEAIAAKTRFKKCIAHGMLSASFISTLIADAIPGPGAIYLSQSLRFVRPVFPGDSVTVKATVKRIEEEESIMTITTVCYNQHGKEVITGEAEVMLDDC